MIAAFVWSYFFPEMFWHRSLQEMLHRYLIPCCRFCSSFFSILLFVTYNVHTQCEWGHGDIRKEKGSRMRTVVEFACGFFLCLFY